MDNKFAGLLAVGVVASGLFATIETHGTSYTGLKEALSASVQLEDYCSATSIQDPDLSDGEQVTFLTAKHCMGPNDKIGTVLKVYIPSSYDNQYVRGSEGLKVIVKDISEESDLVLLQGLKPETDPKLPKVSVYGGIPSAGTPAYAFGYPRGESLTITEGLLSYIIEYDGFNDLSKSNLWQKAGTATQGGSSGGGLMVLTDEGFELVGVLAWGYRGDEGASYWTPVTEIRTFLEQNGDK